MLSIHGIIITNLFQCNNHLKLRRKKQKARITRALAKEQKEVKNKKSGSSIEKKG
jgi:hypothetical protein